MNKRKAFTLIELLVVVSIIALLVSILVPALSAAKQMATGAVCVSNEHGLILAWMMYCEDNEDKMVNGRADLSNFYSPSGGRSISWVGPPMDLNGNYVPGDCSLNDRYRGLQEGALGLYTGQAIDLYHCPGDNRNTLGTRHGPQPMMQIYRSYSVSQAMSTFGGSDGQLAMKICASIRNPSQSVIFCEEAYDGGVSGPTTNINDEYWNYEPRDYSWWDPLAQFHKGATSFSFADGHAEMHKWVEQRTVEYHKDRFGPGNTVFRRQTIDSGQVGDSPDIDWMNQNIGAIFP